MNLSDLLDYHFIVKENHTLKKYLFIFIDFSALPKLPVLDGEVTSLDIHRGHLDLGISIVGGCDTPLVSIVLDE